MGVSLTYQKRTALINHFFKNKNIMQQQHKLYFDVDYNVITKDKKFNSIELNFFHGYYPIVCYVNNRIDYVDEKTGLYVFTDIRTTLKCQMGSMSIASGSDGYCLVTKRWTAYPQISTPTSITDAGDSELYDFDSRIVFNIKN